MTYPTTSEVTFHLTELKEQLFFYVADREAGKVDGYYISNDRSPSSDHMTLHASHLWHITFPNETERIVDVFHKQANGKVRLIGCDHTPYHPLCVYRTCQCGGSQSSGQEYPV